MWGALREDGANACRAWGNVLAHRETLDRRDGVGRMEKRSLSCHEKEMNIRSS